MKFFAILGIAAVLVLGAGSAMAKQVRHGQSIYCATREAGNPYSKLCDYEGWSNWRGEVVGTARSTMLASLIHFIDHLDAHVRFRAAGNA